LAQMTMHTVLCLLYFDCM